MKILHINLSKSGIGYYGLLLAQSMNSKPSKFMFIGNYNAIESDLSKNIIKNFPNDLIKINGIINKILSAFKIMYIILKFRPDIIHDTCGPTLPFTSLFYNFFKKRAKLYITMHDPNPHIGMGTIWYQKISRKLAFKKNIYYVAHGQNSYNILKDEHRISRSKIAIINHGLFDIYNTNNNNEIDEKDKYILFFGVLRPNKGIKLMKPIIDQVHLINPKIKFRIVGSKSMSKEIEKSDWIQKLDIIIKELENTSNVKCDIKYISDDKVGDIFSNAKALILPYKEASQSGVMMIALAKNIPVLATKTGDIQDIISNGENGFLCDFQSSSFVKKIIDIYDTDMNFNFKKTNDTLNWNSISIKTISFYKDRL